MPIWTHKTGWWRKGVPHRDASQPLGGGALIWPIYQHHNQPFPYPEKVIDQILTLQKKDGTWMEFPEYLNLNALYGLAYMQQQAPEYRNEDIQKAVQRYAIVVNKQWKAFCRKKPDTHLLLSMVASFGILQQLLPDQFFDTVQWTDIFSDFRLYQTSKVEVE